MTFKRTIAALAASLAFAAVGAAQDAEAPSEDVIEASAAGDAVDAEGQPAYVRGWLELARIQPVDLLLRAKLDSGALTSALHAEILRGPESRGYPAELDDDVEIDVPAADQAAIAEASADEEVEVEDVEVEENDDDGPQTVVFAVESRQGKRVVFEREIVRWVRVKDRNGGSHSRPVVRMAFCIGGVYVEGDVGLTDRSDFNYPLLVGRRMLTDARIMVASWETFTHESRCYEDGPRPNLD
jgi:hypothetical protein